MSAPVLLSDSVNGSGFGTTLHNSAVSRLLKDDRLAWTHLNADHSDTFAWLLRENGYLSELVLNALLAVLPNIMTQIYFKSDARDTRSVC